MKRLEISYPDKIGVRFSSRNSSTSFHSPPARPTLKCRYTAARQVEGLSQILTAQSWPGIRNKGGAADGRRCNGFTELSANPVHEEELSRPEPRSRQDSLR